jgi:uncharacterized membrane protein
MFMLKDHRTRESRFLAEGANVIGTLRHPWHYRLLGWSLGAVAAGLVLALGPAWLRGTVRIVGAYDAGAIVLLLFYFIVVFRDDPGLTQQRAAFEDPGRNVVLSIIVASVAAGLGGAIVILGKGPDVTTPLEKTVAIALAIVAAVAGWALIHATFAFRYAHLYYFDDGSPGDGLTFPSTKEPDDYDFLYFSFVIGMTFQVSDVVINDSGIRRAALGHAVIAFGYNTAILALGVNLISNMLH